jgi:hypothetical protein
MLYGELNVPYRRNESFERFLGGVPHASVQVNISAAERQASLTPSMEADITDHVWSLDEVIDLL